MNHIGKCLCCVICISFVAVSCLVFAESIDFEKEDELAALAEKRVVLLLRDQLRKKEGSFTQCDQFLGDDLEDCLKNNASIQFAAYDLVAVMDEYLSKYKDKLVSQKISFFTKVRDVTYYIARGFSKNTYIFDGVKIVSYAGGGTSACSEGKIYINGKKIFDANDIQTDVPYLLCGLTIQEAVYSKEDVIIYMCMKGGAGSGECAGMKLLYNIPTNTWKLIGYFGFPELISYSIGNEHKEIRGVGPLLNNGWVSDTEKQQMLEAFGSAYTVIE